MANTLSVMTNAIRNVVSKKRIRYKDKGFNLDLAYICDNIIAMGYPADNCYEGIYRNRLEDVYQFFEESHADHYKIYNLCSERSYDVAKFRNRVSVYPFDDHNPPTIELIQTFCDDVDCWLKADSQNVVAIHCKAGKGRTGTMICCYLLYCGFMKTADEVLDYYAAKRTKDCKGVTIPSQRRYVEYFARIRQSGLPYDRRTLQINEIRFSHPLLMHNQGSVHCTVSSLPDPMSAAQVRALQTFSIDFRKTSTIEIKDRCLPLTGDVKIEVYHKVLPKKFFHFWFNTYFVPENSTVERQEDGEEDKLVYELTKFELDDAHKDKEHKQFPEDFKVHLVLQRIPPRSSNDIINRDLSQNNYTMNHVASINNSQGQGENSFNNHHHHRHQQQKIHSNHLLTNSSYVANSNSNSTNNSYESSNNTSMMMETSLTNRNNSKQLQNYTNRQQQPLPPSAPIHNNHINSRRPGPGDIHHQQQQHLAKNSSNHTQQNNVLTTTTTATAKLHQRHAPSFLTTTNAATAVGATNATSPDLNRTNSKNSNTSTMSSNSSSSSINSQSSSASSSGRSGPSSAVGEDWESGESTYL